MQIANPIVKRAQGEKCEKSAPNAYDFNTEPT